MATTIMAIETDADVAPLYPVDEDDDDEREATWAPEEEAIPAAYGSTVGIFVPTAAGQL